MQAFWERFGVTSGSWGLSNSGLKGFLSCLLSPPDPPSRVCELSCFDMRGVCLSQNRGLSDHSRHSGIIAEFWGNLLQHNGSFDNLPCEL